MSSDKHSKTEAPSAKRKKEARQQGQIPKSREMTTWVSLLVATWVVPLMFRRAVKSVSQLLAHTLALVARPDEGAAVHLLGEGLGTAVLAVAPLAIGLMLVAVLTNVAQTGLVVSTKRLKPKFSNLNPTKGIKRLLSPSSVWEGAKSLLKVGLLILVAWQTLRGVVPRFSDTGSVPLGTLIQVVVQQAINVVRKAAMLGLILALMDYAFQRRRIRKQMMMSKQELKEENKTTEGNPEIKNAIKARQFKMSRMRMMAEVAKADVVIVNPTHVSVALRYDPVRGAPRVLAKGTDEVALRIREEAERNGVPLVEDVPLARTLYRMCDIGAEIPAELYEAVARVLAFLFTLRATGRVRQLGGGPLRAPTSALLDA